MRWVKVATEMSSLVSMLFRTFLNPLKFLMEFFNILVRVRVRVDFILQNLAPPGTTVHVPTAWYIVWPARSSQQALRGEEGKGRSSIHRD